MDIKELVYELYKGDWKIHHGIFRQQETTALKEYYRYCQDATVKCSFEEWLQEFGYDGGLYAGMDEFLNNEYLDEAYIKGLLDSDDLFQQYQQDLEQEVV